MWYIVLFLNNTPIPLCTRTTLMYMYIPLNAVVNTSCIRIYSWSLHLVTFCAPFHRGGEKQWRSEEELLLFQPPWPMCWSHHVRTETGGTTGLQKAEESLQQDRRVLLEYRHLRQACQGWINPPLPLLFFFFLTVFFQNHPTSEGAPYMNYWIYGPNVYNNREFMITFSFFSLQVRLQSALSLSLSLTTLVCSGQVFFHNVPYSCSLQFRKLICRGHTLP